MKPKDLRIMYYMYIAESTGKYEITRFGNRRSISKYREYCKTPSGEFPIDEWMTIMRKAIHDDGKDSLLEKIVERCSNFDFLDDKEKVICHSMDCLASESYKKWKDFNWEELNE